MRVLTNHILLLFFLFNFSFLIFNFHSCTSSGSAPASQNVSNIYRPEKEQLHPEYTVYHRTGTITELYFKINSKELLYSKKPGDDNFTARIGLHYRLISSYETKEIIDSATVLIEDSYASKAKEILGKIEINATFTNSYLLQTELHDLNRGTSIKSYTYIDKTDKTGRQNFLLLNNGGKTPLFRDYVAAGEKINIRYKLSDRPLYVRYYNRDFPLPAPPFSTSNIAPFEYGADSLFMIPSSGADTVSAIFNRVGFYHIQTDTNTRQGLTVFCFRDHYPLIKTSDQMLEPIRYITSRNEYSVLESNPNRKAAVDSFWVYTGGGHDRARELVKKYYSRVEDANNYFSSYVEGWKTDRGMVYIVFGPPNIVYRSSESESWVYGEENNFNSLTFTFLKVINPFSDNDYRLERSSFFETRWRNNVEMWRQGRVYGGR